LIDLNEHNGIVSSVRLASNPFDNIYNVIGQKVIQTNSSMQIELYDKVVTKEENLEKSGTATKEEYAKALSSLLESIDIDGNIKDITLGKDYEKVAIKMMPELAKAARLLIKAFVSGAPIVVRFHNDGDGSTGGIALYRALAQLQQKFFIKERAVSWQMNRSIAYTLESFYTDKMLFGSYESAEKPLVVITDFGTSPESVDAIKASQDICEIIWLDHHVPYEGFPNDMITHYINVFGFGGDSNFTAGLLTCIFAQILAKINVEDLKDAALVSDFSAYADFKSESALKNAIILDYLTSSNNEMHSKPKQMDAIISNKEKSESTFRHANGQLEEAISEGIKNLSSYKNADGITISLLDFSHVAKLGLDYPLPGRYTSRLQDRLESKNGGKTITVVYYGSFISMRTSKDIQGSIDILKIIEKLRADTNGAVSGGGHKQAASIKTDRGNIKEVTRLLLIELGVTTN
jgi:archaea-specific RecJ-like exonuclease